MAAGGFFRSRRRVALTVVGVSAWLVFLAGFSGCLHYKNELLGIALIKHIVASKPAASVASTPTRSPHVVAYDDSRWGFSFDYLWPKYTVVGDQGELQDLANLAVHDHLVVVVPTDALASQRLPSILLAIYVDNWSRFLKDARPDAYQTREGATQAAALLAYELHEGYGARWVFRTKGSVGARSAVELVMTGKMSGRDYVFAGYCVSTATHIYTLVFMSPKGPASQLSKSEAACASLIDTFSFH
jgi:hypothetical protein